MQSRVLVLEKAEKVHDRSIHEDNERRKRDGFKTLPLDGIYGYVAMKHGNSRNMADISNDYHFTAFVCA